MKKTFCFLLVLLSLAQAVIAQHQWTWVSGQEDANSPANYGLPLISSPSNYPGSRTDAISWTDNNGNFWLFGGQGFTENGSGLLNDLWRYNPESNRWTWMSGSSNTNRSGAYGVRGLPLPTNSPGARRDAVSWIDNAGNLWLFGGLGYADTDESGLLNDLWRFSPSTLQWTWMGGDNDINTRGEYGKRGNGNNDDDDDDDDDDDNDNDNEELFPGGRSMAAAWTDNAGNFWLFGGRGYSSRDEVSDLNDMWRYSVANNEWTWMKGDRDDDADARYGQKGSFDNRNSPQGLRGSAAWIDNQGKFWLYGGANRGNLHSDLWKFDPATSQWAWVSGEKTSNHAPRFAEPQIPNESANPGSRLRMTTWTDKQNNLWLFGGEGYGNNGIAPLNSMWRYSIQDNTWTFEKGTLNTAPGAEYGTKGEAGNDNTPAGTSSAVGWKNELDNLFVFGGQTSQGVVNQLWKFTGCPLAQLGKLTPEKVTLCKGDSQVLTASGGTTYEWRRNGEKIAGETSATLTVTEAGTYSVLISRGQCSAPAPNESVVKVITQPEGSITPATAALCQGAVKELTATGGTSYEWRRNDVVIAGQTAAKLSVSEPGTYSVVIINGSCRAPASNEAVITQTEPPQGSIVPASATICEGSSQTLTANGGTSYQWLRDGVKIAGETGATLNVDQAGTYSVIISNGECTAEATNHSVISIGNQAGSRYADVLVNANTPTRLTAREGGTSYEWSPVTGIDNPTSPSPAVTTNTQREYLVRITTDQGCTFTDTVLVKINPEIIVAKVAVPTAFTPNGNGSNDRLRPLGNIASIDYFKVYNRWGNMVFQTNQIGDGWDGTFKGAPQPSDTYTWVLVGRSQDGQIIKQTGKTLLIR